METYYGWKIEFNDTYIILLHEESGHSFEFERKSEDPYFVEEIFTGMEGDGTDIKYDHCVDRAFEIAYKIAKEIHS